MDVIRYIRNRSHLSVIGSIRRTDSLREGDKLVCTKLIGLPDHETSW